MFDYGKVYSKLPVEKVSVIYPSLKLGGSLSFLAGLYFKLFGYPDVAGHMRYRKIIKILKPKKNEVILDAGCGNGIYCHELGDRFRSICYGIDGRAGKIKISRKVNKLLKLHNVFKKSLLERLNLGKKGFDKIICLEVLEHIRNDKKVLVKLSGYLKKGGIMIVTIPMKGTALGKEQEKNPNFIPEPFEHVRSGYEYDDLQNMGSHARFERVLIEPYFFLFSKYSVRIQQYLYKNKMIVLNLALSPLLTLLTYLDDIFKIYPRGYIMVLRK